MRKESDWQNLVFICMILLLIIAIFKFLFWVSIVSIIMGIIWLIINLFSKDQDLSWFPLILIIIGIILAVISYQIGYGFEKSELGKPIVESAKIIVETDNTINKLEQNLTTELIEATQKAIKDVKK